MLLLFVYGSLLQGEPSHHLLDSARFVGPGRSAARFSLADLGEYPAMVPGGETAVSGEIYEVDAETLAQLDVFEGHPELYQRTSIELEGGASIEAYLLTQEQAWSHPLVRSGDWRAYVRSR